MSRGFVKEDDQEEIPLVTPRAYLPAGHANYVTPTGFKALKAEQRVLVDERKALRAQSIENNRVQINYLTSKLALLEERINSAKIVDLSNQEQDKIRFGARITIYKKEEDCISRYQIVGVDEANVSQNKISFLSPLAKALLNKKAGDEIILHTPDGKRFIRIEAIEYS